MSRPIDRAMLTAHAESLPTRRAAVRGRANLPPVRRRPAPQPARPRLRCRCRTARLHSTPRRRPPIPCMSASATPASSCRLPEVAPPNDRRHRPIRLPRVRSRRAACSEPTIRRHDAPPLAWTRTPWSSRSAPTTATCCAASRRPASRCWGSSLGERRRHRRSPRHRHRNRLLQHRNGDGRRRPPRLRRPRRRQQRAAACPRPVRFRRRLRQHPRPTASSRWRCRICCPWCSACSSTPSATTPTPTSRCRCWSTSSAPSACASSTPNACPTTADHSAVQACHAVSAYPARSGLKAVRVAEALVDRERRRFLHRLQRPGCRRAGGNQRLPGNRQDPPEAASPPAAQSPGAAPC